MLGEKGEGPRCPGAQVEGCGWVLGCSVPPSAPPSETVDQAVETYGLQKITLLREISRKTGIQVGWV